MAGKPDKAEVGWLLEGLLKKVHDLNLTSDETIIYCALEAVSENKDAIEYAKSIVNRP